MRVGERDLDGVFLHGLDLEHALHSFLQSQVDEGGNPLFAVTARDRVGSDCDPLLSRLDSSEFDELWLVALDDGNGLTALDCERHNSLPPPRWGVIANPRSSGCWIVLPAHPHEGAVGVPRGERRARVSLRPVEV